MEQAWPGSGIGLLHSPTGSSLPKLGAATKQITAKAPEPARSQAKALARFSRYSAAQEWLGKKTYQKNEQFMLNDNSLHCEQWQAKPAIRVLQFTTN
jgi:hypothetical protein